LNVTSILAELRSERARIDAAIAALEKGSGKPARNGRTRARRRRLTPEGRKRLSEMMKKRWAERKRRSKAA
jgi:Spy/CpxP family protein refolding chaperone